MKIAECSDGDKTVSLATLATQLEGFIREAARQGSSLEVVERTLFQSLLKIGHAGTEQFLKLQGDGDQGSAITSPTGQTLVRSDTPVDRPLRTIFGEHTIHAYVYAAGPHQKIDYRPIDMRLQLPPGKCSYLFEEFSQYFCIEQAFARSAEAVEKVFGQKVSVDTLERLNRRLGVQAGEFLDHLPKPPPPEEGELLVVSADGKGVPLVRPEAERLPALVERERPGNRRMATLATVYSVDRHVRTAEEIVAALFRDEWEAPRRPRPEPQFKHLVARFTEVHEDSDEAVTIPGPLIALGWANAQVERRRQRGQPLLCLMDGQPSLWEAAETCLEQPANEVVQILDIIHVAGYVWRAAQALSSATERSGFVRERLLRILQGDVRGVVRGLRSMVSRRHLPAASRQEVATVCSYFTNNRERMRYDRYLRQGYPIATGVIEGACRHLVKDRMERSGMRWRLSGAQPMLSLRAVQQSSYWEKFHKSRIAKEQGALHPHRRLLREYIPLAFAA